jgi:hypothetical protein
VPKPDWNDKQKPNQKSKEHGKKDHGHGPDEHGLGGDKDPKEHGPKQDPDDLATIEPDEGEPETAVGGEPLASITLPSSYYVPNPPPVTDQDGTPMCVAYSNAYDQNQQDRPEAGKFWNFDEKKFFGQIGGGPNGAYLTAGLTRRRDFGYPEQLLVSGQDGNPNYARHKIASYTQIPLTVAAIKAALQRGHGVLMIGDWFHSWFHPFASGKLPAPDYKVGGHAQYIRGWNDAYGFRLRNSWGTDWGVNGDAFIPYAFLSRYYAAYRTTDK